VTDPPEPHLLLHRDTGAILYATVATREEIARANARLEAHGERLRYVPARLVGH
jgi:hypothetical protein